MRIPVDRGAPMVGYSPLGREESDMTDRLTHTDIHIHTHVIFIIIKLEGMC